MPDSTPNPQPSSKASQPRRLVWDLPTRLFHWTLALIFISAFSLALLSSEHSRTFMLHMLAGLVLVFVIALRLVWGLVGSTPSRFSSFMFSPLALVRYIREVVSGKDRPSPGHNPGSSYAIYAMLLLPLGLAATGLMKNYGQKWAEEIHVVLAYGMVAVISLHIIGVAWHAFRHRDDIALAMVDGRRPVSETDAIPSSRSWAGALFVLLVGGWSVALTSGFNATIRQVTLPGFKTALPLGEAKKDKEASKNSERGSKKHHDHER